MREAEESEGGVGCGSDICTPPHQPVTLSEFLLDEGAPPVRSALMLEIGLGGGKIKREAEEEHEDQVLQQQQELEQQAKRRRLSLTAPPSVLEEGTADDDLVRRMRQLDSVLGITPQQQPTLVVSVPANRPVTTTVRAADDLDLIEKQNASLRVRTFRCPKCPASGTAFEDADALSRHILACHNSSSNNNNNTSVPESPVTPGAPATAPAPAPAVKPYACQSCDLRFNSMGARNSHRRKVHQRSFLCSRCDIAFGSAQKLARHLRTHTGVKEFRCALCSKEFMDERNLVLHHKLHRGEQDFKCGACGRKYYTKSGLQHHQRQVHSKGEFPCPECRAEASEGAEPKTFPTKYDLLLHRREAHGGAGAEKCNVCSARFPGQVRK